MICVYDISTDMDREATQDDIDRLQRTASAYAELVKHMRFHIAEVRNGLVSSGRALKDILLALEEAEATARSMSLDEKIEMGPVHGHHILVVER